MRGMTKIINSNGIVTYSLPYNHKLMQEHWNRQRRREIEKIENFIESLDNKDACIALRVLLHNHKKSKKIRRIIDAEKERGA